MTVGVAPVHQGKVTGLEMRQFGQLDGAHLVRCRAHARGPRGFRSDCAAIRDRRCRRLLEEYNDDGAIEALKKRLAPVARAIRGGLAGSARAR